MNLESSLAEPPVSTGDELPPKQIDYQTTLKRKWVEELVRDYPGADEMATKALVDLYFEDQQYIDDIAEGRIEVPPAIERKFEKTYVGISITNDDEELKKAEEEFRVK